VTAAVPDRAAHGRTFPLPPGVTAIMFVHAHLLN
jgi:hypothetical protein